MAEGALPKRVFLLENSQGRWNVWGKDMLGEKHIAGPFATQELAEAELERMGYKKGAKNATT